MANGTGDVVNMVKFQAPGIQKTQTKPKDRDSAKTHSDTYMQQVQVISTWQCTSKDVLINTNTHINTCCTTIESYQKSDHSKALRTKQIQRKGWRGELTDRGYLPLLG